ncbi:type II secretion system F family protein [uncultured Ilumatobacter sp.]|uniref:type II secretion system F family protein n=1 Tax=uncultured Ilumatobacter sp. TaxID=879968 RepID=UPI00374F6054
MTSTALGVLLAATGVALIANLVTSRRVQLSASASNHVASEVDLDHQEDHDISRESDHVPVIPSYRRSALTGGARLNSMRVDAIGLVNATPERLRDVGRTQLVATGIIATLMVLVVANNPTPASLVAAVIAAGGAWQMPLIAARRRETDRLRTLDRELGDALGELVMGVEAGLTLEAVLVRYAQRRTSPLASEFDQMTQSVQLGATRRDAIAAFTNRNATPTVRLFAAAVEQNQTLGTPLAGVLRQQATTIRRHRRQAAETDAAKLSMKMIFPTIFCILPVLLIVVVGPAIVRLVDVL